MRRMVWINTAALVLLLEFTGAAYIIRRRALLTLRSHQFHIQIKDGPVLQRLQTESDVWQSFFLASGLLAIFVAASLATMCIARAIQRRPDGRRGFEVIR